MAACPYIPRLAYLLAILLSAVQTAKPCTVFPPEPVEVPSNFAVKLEDRGRPVQGMRIILQPGSAARPMPETGNEQPKSAISDTRGEVRFSGIPNGVYHLQMDAEHGTELDIEVSGRLIDPKCAITMQWPILPVVDTQRPAGTLQTACDSDSAICEFRGRVSLFRARDLHEITSADIRGSFDFGVLPPGLYFLKIDSNNKNNQWSPQGDVAFEIDPQSANLGLTLDIGMTSCGMYYSHGNCSNRILPAENLCGQVVDPARAVIGNAHVALLDASSSKLVNTTRTDSNGYFDLNSATRDGDYNLTIASPGFSTLRQAITLRKSGSCVKRATIQLGVFGNCGKMIQE